MKKKLCSVIPSEVKFRWPESVLNFGYQQKVDFDIIRKIKKPVAYYQIAHFPSPYPIHFFFNFARRDVITTYQSMRTWPIWFQIGNKTCYILKVSKFYVKKEFLGQQARRHRYQTKTPFFLLALSVLSVGIFHFCISKP